MASQLQWRVEVHNQISLYLQEDGKSYGPFPTARVSDNVLGYQLAVAVGATRPSGRANYTVPPMSAVQVGYQDPGTFKYGVDVYGTMPAPPTNLGAVSDGTYVLHMGGVKLPPAASLARTDAQWDIVLDAATAAVSRYTFTVNGLPYFVGTLVKDANSATARILLTAYAETLDPFGPAYITTQLQMGVPASGGGGANGPSLPPTASSHLPFSPYVPFGLASTPSGPGLVSEYGYDMYWQAGPVLGALQCTGDKVFSGGNAARFSGWTGAMLSAQWQLLHAPDPMVWTTLMPEAGVTSCRIGGLSQGTSDVTRSFAFEPVERDGAVRLALRVVAANDAGSDPNVYLGINEIPGNLGFYPLAGYPSPPGDWTAIRDPDDPTKSGLLYRSLATGITYALLDGKFVWGHSIPYGNGESCYTCTTGIYPFNVAQGVPVAAADQTPVSLPEFLPYGPRDASGVISTTLAFPDASYLQSYSDGDWFFEFFNQWSSNLGACRGGSPAFCCVGQALPCWYPTPWVGLHGMWTFTLATPLFSPGEYQAVSNCLAPVQSLACQPAAGSVLYSSSAPLHVCSVMQTPAGGEYCDAGMAGLGVGNAAAASPQAQSDAAAFLGTVCGQLFEPGVGDTIQCAGVLGVPATQCSGFKTANFGDACKAACAINPPYCDTVKAGFCAANPALPDCACLNLDTSPFANPEASGAGASGTSSGGLTYRQFVQSYVATNGALVQAVRPHCWWQPCAAGLDNAALVTTDLVNDCPSDFLDCVARVRNVHVSGDSSLTLDILNTCDTIVSGSAAGGIGTGSGASPGLVTSSFAGPFVPASASEIPGGVASSSVGQLPPPPGLSPALVAIIVVVCVVLALAIAALVVVKVRPDWAQRVLRGTRASTGDTAGATAGATTDTTRKPTQTL
jgi:hypothetical protein